MKVMIVDDDLEFTHELAELLQSMGYEVETFVDSVIALNVVHRVKPAIIILDIKMDRINGYQAAWYLRKFEETATIPIIGMSAYSGDGDPQQLAAACGMNAFLQKPFYPYDLIAKIEQLTAVSPAGADEKQASVPPATKTAAVSVGAARAGKEPVGLPALKKPIAFSKRSTDKHSPLPLSGK